MHIEKNVCDNLLGTFLNLEGNSKDNEKGKKDLQNMEIRAHLWLIENPNKKHYIPPAECTMSSDDKEMFLRVLKYLKVPGAYASNISRCVNLKDRKILNLKSHDNHILMQGILPIALRASKSSELVDLISHLCSFFKRLYSKVLDPNKLDELHVKVVVILCRMEKVFLVSSQLWFTCLFTSLRKLNLAGQFITDECILLKGNHICSFTYFLFLECLTTYFDSNLWIKNKIS